MLNWRKKKTANAAQQAEISALQHTVSILLDADVRTTSDGNPYTTPAAQVRELARKYEGVSEWGCQLVQSVVDFRAAMVIGGGLDFVPGDGFDETSASRELEFINQFASQNDLDGETAADWVRESEIEGKILLRLMPDIPSMQVKARWVSWTKYGYTITAAPDDYQDYILATYTMADAGKQVSLKPNEFVYCLFGGRTSNVNDGCPRLGSVLRNFESLDRALWDWRKINRYFASPTPYFKVENAQEGAKLDTWIKTNKWRIGKYLVGTADFALVCMDGAGIESIMREIENNAQIISGHTGTPIQMLGFANLLNGRTTADSLYDGVNAAISRPRQLWQSTFTELGQKAIAMANNKLQAGLNPQAIKAVLPEIPSAQFSQLMDKWVKLYEKGLLSRQSTIERIPDVDVEEEIVRIDEEEAEKQAKELDFEKKKNQTTDNSGNDGDSAGRGVKSIDNIKQIRGKAK